MMHFYSALLCIVIHPMRFTIIWGGGGGGCLVDLPVTDQEEKCHAIQTLVNFSETLQATVLILDVLQSTFQRY